MIFKSYLVEENINLLDKNLVLFYGENLGLKDKLKNEIIKVFKNYEIINIYQEDFNKNKDILVNEFKNSSLFSNKKLIPFIRLIRSGTWQIAFAAVIILTLFFKFFKFFTFL